HSCHRVCPPVLAAGLVGIRRRTGAPRPLKRGALSTTDALTGCVHTQPRPRAHSARQPPQHVAGLVAGMTMAHQLGATAARPGGPGHTPTPGGSGTGGSIRMEEP